MTRHKPVKSPPSFFAAPPLPLPVAQAPYPQAPYPFTDEAARAVPSNFDIRVSVSVDRDATVATAVLNESNRPYAVPLARATGSAVRQRADEHDPETATLLAAERALRKLAGKLGKAARARVKSADSTRAGRERSKGRKRLATSVVTGGIDSDGTVVVHVPEGDLPDGLREMVQNLFPARDLKFVEEPESVSLPEQIEDFLADPEGRGVHRERPQGRHARPEQDGS